MNIVSNLRSRHPRFHYRAYSYSVLADSLQISFDFELEPNIKFTPQLSLPLPASSSSENLDALVFNLGMVEMLSYWKLSCAPEIAVHAAALTSEQCLWWHDLAIYGMSEFYFRNQIDFSVPNFLTISSNSEKNLSALQKKVEGDLLLVGGGKDSTLGIEILKKLKVAKRQIFLLNQQRSAIDSVVRAGLTSPLIASRTLDPQLLKLNRQGYLNGHTPFSAYLAFLGSLQAYLLGLQDVVVFNEQSANEANSEFHGIPVNHQYSKTSRFEEAFRYYQNKYLSPSLNYFSFLRPLHDIQVSGLFSQCKTQLTSFRSCNVGQKNDVWCKDCAKCAFVYLTLFPFLDYKKVLEIFGEDLFNRPTICQFINDLCGLGEVKPFECVGTSYESQQALFMSIQNLQRQNLPIPGSLTKIIAALESRGIHLEKDGSILKAWAGEHFLPAKYEAHLKQELNLFLDSLKNA